MQSTSSRDARWCPLGFWKKRGKALQSPGWPRNRSTNDGFSPSMWVYRRLTSWNSFNITLLGGCGISECHVSENGGNGWNHPPSTMISDDRDRCWLRCLMARSSSMRLVSKCRGLKHHMNHNQFLSGHEKHHLWYISRWMPGLFDAIPQAALDFGLLAGRRSRWTHWPAPHYWWAWDCDHDPGCQGSKCQIPGNK